MKKGMIRIESNCDWSAGRSWTVKVKRCSNPSDKTRVKFDQNQRFWRILKSSATFCSKRLRREFSSLRPCAVGYSVVRRRRRFVGHLDCIIKVTTQKMWKKTCPFLLKWCLHNIPSREKDREASRFSIALISSGDLPDWVLAWPWIHLWTVE